MSFLILIEGNLGIMFYLLNLLIIPIYFWIISLQSKNREIRNKRFAIWACIHITLFRALADPYNYVDTVGYADGFINLSNMSFSEAVLSLNYYTHWGQGYLIYNWLLGQFTYDPKYLFIISSFVGVIPIIWYYYKTSKRLLLAVLLFLTYPMMYYMGFGVLREHLAVSFVLLALFYVDKWKISIPLAVTGFLFHTSAIIFFPFYFWKRIDFSSKSKAFFYVAAIVIIMRWSMWYILSFMPKYEEIVQAKELENNIIPVLLLGIVSFAISQIKINKCDIQSQNIKSIIYYGLAVSIFSVGLAGLGRLTIYFLYVIPSAMSIIMCSKRHRFINFITLVLVLIIYVRQIYYFLQVKNMNYTFFWE